MTRSHADRRRILRARRLWIAYGGNPRRVDFHLRDDGTANKANKREHRRDAHEEQLGAFGRAVARLSSY